RGGAASPGPVVVFICIPAAIWPCIVAFRWRHYSEFFRDNIGRPLDPLWSFIGGSSEPPKMNFNRLLLVVNIGWCLFCSIPLWMMLGGCTSALG
ncbi:MAG TPA: hypothetical protein VGC82_20840, partial [Rhodopila sp.]